MSFVKFLLVSALLISLEMHGTTAAPSSISIASAGGSGAFAGTGDDGEAVAMSGVPTSKQSGSELSSGTVTGSNLGNSASLLSRSGGSSSSQPKTQSVVVGPNGDTTILQQNGDQPPKVYKING